MHKMPRKQALAACKAAGTKGDRARLTRITIENRVSQQAALEAYREGVRFARFVAQRDAGLFEMA